MSTVLDEFWAQYDFAPDPFQVEAAEAIAEGLSLVVTAPTGAGKTLVAEAAIHLARGRGSRAFYTTPIKALSNQKYSDFSQSLGSQEVGLLTGDNVVNPRAPVIVATLEVLRNMIYADPEALAGVGLVVLDEAHYLQDRARGAAWEEVIIHCPSHVQFVCLSATISNDSEFASWVETRRGPTRLVSTDHRPVPLESMYMIKDRLGGQALHLLPTFVRRDGRTRPNPRIEHMLGLERGSRRRFRTPSRAETVERLAAEDMLPAIYFIFSRSGCDSAAARLTDAGIRLTGRDDRESIRGIVEERTSHLTDTDLAVLGYDQWITGLEAGIAAHHAGLVPAFKETVEELFAAGLLKVVFATETLALGINMPARSVVLESLTKFNGENHDLLRPGDYTQLTGRAGRRGIDVEGFGVVLHSSFLRFSQVTEVASLGAHELKSSFRPTYNMTANLIANYPQEQAEAMLEASFAAFQRETEMTESADMVDAIEHQVAHELELARCERGSVEEYMALVESLAPKTRNEGIAASLGAGDVVEIVGGSRDGRYAILRRLARKDEGTRYLVVSTSGRVDTLGYRDITAASHRVGAVTLPTPFKPRDRRFIQELLRQVRKIPPRRSDRSPQTHMLVQHPVADCPDASRHVAALRRAQRLQRRLEQHLARRRAGGHGLVEEFAAIRVLLEERDYASGWGLTPRGERLRGLYNESDLLLAESIEHGVFFGLEPSELAALLSVFVYEPRSDQVSAADWPGVSLAGRWEAIERLWTDLSTAERAARLTPARRPDPGFGRLAHLWASGTEFDELPTKGMAPGDFVRVSRQLVDLLRQVKDAVPELADEAAIALKQVDRGVVAAQGVG
ncbi:MAG: DEAD/DEAH box helicase [Actinobacteria bacterium]|nr:DEAD/DEAH box helicase [Actinomycetota bacterium]